MKYLFVRVLVLTALVVGGTFTSVAFAQSLSPESTSLYEEVTEVFVDNVIVTEPARAGGNLAGSFMLHNVGATTLSDVRFRIELVQLVDADIEVVPSEALHTSPISDSFILLPGAKNVQFTYQLPQALPSGKIGLLVQVYEQNMTPVAQDFTQLSVSGPTVTYVSQSSLLVINDVEGYELLEGPVVTTADVADIDVELFSEFVQPVLFTPTLRVFEGTYEHSVPVHEQVFEPIQLLPEELVTTQYVLPNTTLTPGVYTAVLTFTSINQDAAISPIEARFIVDGLQPKIESVRYGATNLTETGNQFTVHVTYTDVPINLRRNEDGTFRDARTAALFATSSEASVFGDAVDALLPTGMSATVRIADGATGQLLATEQLTFDTRSPQRTATFTDITGVSDITVTVELSRDGVLIDSFNETVSVVSAEKQNIFAELWYAYPMQIIVGSIVLLLLVVVITVVSRIRKKKMNNPVIRG